MLCNGEDSAVQSACFFTRLSYREDSGHHRLSLPSILWLKRRLVNSYLQTLRADELASPQRVEMNSVTPTTVEAQRLRAFTFLSRRFSGDRGPGSRKGVKAGRIELVGQHPASETLWVPAEETGEP